MSREDFVIGSVVLPNMSMSIPMPPAKAPKANVIDAMTITLDFDTAAFDAKHKHVMDKIAELKAALRDLAGVLG